VAALFAGFVWRTVHCSAGRGGEKREKVGGAVQRKKLKGKARSGNLSTTRGGEWNSSKGTKEKRGKGGRTTGHWEPTWQEGSSPDCKKVKKKRKRGRKATANDQKKGVKKAIFKKSADWKRQGRGGGKWRRSRGSIKTNIKKPKVKKVA